MEWRAEPSETGEELAFGDGDSERESRLRVWEAAGRRWASAHRRPLAVVAAVVVLLGLVGGGGRYLYLKSREPLPPPDVALPVQDRFSVFLCEPEIPECQAGGAAATRDLRRIETELRAVPGVASVRFVSGEAEFQEAGKKHGVVYRTDGLVTTMTRDMFRDAFEGVLTSPGVFGQVAERGGRIAGVWKIYRAPTDFWTGKANVTVTLCGTGAPKACASSRYQSPTERQREVILDRIREVDGVEKIYFEDREHALKLQKHYDPEDRAGPPQLLVNMPESYHVKLARPDAAELIRQALKNVPGVQSVL
ncbi:permease-like cell division protein FtsX [Sphaerisporangium sp. NPDC005289]|uniref:permease-like cell division protein FtsX n=1 Tax=Sphaerisporangium sp. NPDC005289 TaxID=3155247 RepID=UPI0033BAAB28